MGKKFGKWERNFCIIAGLTILFEITMFWLSFQNAYAKLNNFRG